MVWWAITEFSVQLDKLPQDPERCELMYISDESESPTHINGGYILFVYGKEVNIKKDINIEHVGNMIQETHPLTFQAVGELPCSVGGNGRHILYNGNIKHGLTLF